MAEDHDDKESLISFVVREETNATDSHNLGTLSQTDDFEKQVITFLKKSNPELLKPELQNESNDSYMLETQVNQLGPFSNGEEASFDRVRGKALYKGRKSLGNDRKSPVTSGDKSASACSNPVNSGGDDATGGEYYSSLSDELPSEGGDCISVMASNASTYHRQLLTDKKEADILSLFKARSSTSKRNSQSNKDSGIPSKRKRCSQAGQLSSDLDLHYEEEILLEYDKSHIANNEEGPESLKALAERVDRCWSEEPLNISSVKTMLEEYKYPKNVTKFIVPTLNEEIREAVHPALLRMDQKYVALQKNLIHATSALAYMANSILSADRKGHMQDSKAVLKTSLDVITILGHSHNELNKRRSETISSGLNKESRQSCKTTIEKISVKP